MTFVTHTAVADPTKREIQQAVRFRSECTNQRRLNCAAFSDSPVLANVRTSGGKGGKNWRVELGVTDTRSVLKIKTKGHETHRGV